MVKRQKEKQYQSAQEHRANSQIRSGSAGIGSGGSGGAVRKLPFNCCALSLMPFTTPVCTSNGIIFEKTAIESFLEEHKIDPVSGTAMSKSDLLILNMDKDEEQRWQCPVLTKPFSDHSKIVGIKQPGSNEVNVYSYEAYHELNVKAKNYECLISGQKFNKKKDVIILNSDPTDHEFHKARDINSFFHVKNQRQLEQKTPKNSNIRHSVTATRIMEKVNKSKQDTEDANKKKRAKDQEDLQKEGKRLRIFTEDVTGVRMNTGKAASSLTSTCMDAAYENEAREATDEEVLRSMFQVLRRRKKKGYVRIQTNLGNLLVEIHCDMVPRTATNFMKLCEAKKYNGSSSHRLIQNFMVQFGKPPKSSEAAGEEDESIWGGSFRDEFHDRLKHDGPGILSMANAGAHTNRRQFFVTFKSCEHLNRKHSVFGVVIEGMELLKTMEKIPTDKKDRPVHEVSILDTVVVENPVKEAEELERKRFEAKADARNKGSSNNTQQQKVSAASAKQMASPPKKSQVGKYLPKTALAAASESAKEEEVGAGGTPKLSSLVPKPKAQAAAAAKPKKKFGNFSGW